MWCLCKVCGSEQAYLSRLGRKSGHDCTIDWRPLCQQSTTLFVLVARYWTLMYKMLLTLIFMLLLNYCSFYVFLFHQRFCCGSSVILTMVCMWVMISGKLWNWHAVVAA